MGTAKSLSGQASRLLFTAITHDPHSDRLYGISMNSVKCCKYSDKTFEHCGETGFGYDSRVVETDRVLLYNHRLNLSTDIFVSLPDTIRSLHSIVKWRSNILNDIHYWQSRVYNLSTGNLCRGTRLAVKHCRIVCWHYTCPGRRFPVFLQIICKKLWRRLGIQASGRPRRRL